MNFLGMNLTELLAAVFGVLGVYLTTRQNIWSWPVGILNVGLYIFVFYGAKLYADMGLQVVYLVLCAYGWYHWLYGGKDKNSLPVTRVTPSVALIQLVIGGVGATALGTFLARTTDASLPYLDSTLTVYSLVAQWMLTRKILENWIVWIAVDLVYIGMYYYKDLRVTAVLYLLFLILAFKGYADWKKSLHAAEPASS